MRIKELVFAGAIAAILVISMPGVQSVVLPSNASASVSFTVYPNGSVGVSYTVSETNTTTPGTIPDASFQEDVTTANGMSTSVINGTGTIPQTYLSEPPYNYSGAISVSGTYSNGITQGEVNIHAVPGLESPFTSIELSYHGTANSLTVNGSTTLQYGTYQEEGATLQLNQTTISSILAVYQSELNSTALNSMLAQVPQANLSVSQFSLTAQYGTSSATIVGSAMINGNISAIAPALASQSIMNEISALSSLSSSSSIGTGVVAAEPNMTAIYSAYSSEYGAVKSYSYQLTYSNGLFGVQETVQQSPSANEEQWAQVLKSVEQSIPANLTGMQTMSILNSTKINLEDFQASLKVSQQASGQYTLTTTGNNITVIVPITKSGNTLNMSAFFELFNGSGVFPGSVTVSGGTNSQGTVTMTVPSSVPAPTSTSKNSATWSSVDISQLAGLKFTIGQPSSSSSSVIVYVAIAAVAVVAIGGSLAYFLLRRKPAPVPPAAPVAGQ